jgi:Tol biopolymer transport system component
LPAFAAAQPATTRVSVGSGGIQSNHPSIGPAISADGRWVAFDSSASNLAPEDANDTQDVFLHDRQTGTTTRLSVGPGGASGNMDSDNPAISPDGRWVAFSSLATNLVADDANAEVTCSCDRQTGALRVSVGLGAEADATRVAGDQRGRALGCVHRWRNRAR